MQRVLRFGLCGPKKRAQLRQRGAETGRVFSAVQFEPDVVAIRDDLPSISRWPNQPRHRFDQSSEGLIKTLVQLISDKNSHIRAVHILASLINFVGCNYCQMRMVEALR